jgi:hypothetical protein
MTTCYWEENQKCVKMTCGTIDGSKQTLMDTQIYSDLRKTGEPQFKASDGSLSNGTLIIRSEADTNELERKR